MSHHRTALDRVPASILATRLRGYAPFPPDAPPSESAVVDWLWQGHRPKRHLAIRVQDMLKALERLGTAVWRVGPLTDGPAGDRPGILIPETAAAWSISAMPRDFFDSAQLGLSEAPDETRVATRKALALLRPRGLILWHGVCPDEEVLAADRSARTVMQALVADWALLEFALCDLFLVVGTRVLVGVKR